MERGRSRLRPRRAAHAGSWYDSDPASLAGELRRWLQRSSKVCYGPTKALICPHAGLRFSGSTAACAWKQVDTSNIRRVFILGPSHHKYFKGAALPSENCTEYLTPFGGLPLDIDILQSLRKTNDFSELSPSEDEEEHSIELMLPFIRHIFPHEVKLIPMVVGDLKAEADYQKYADLLIDYFLRDENLFVISSDFCHWGPRYSYYYLEEPLSNRPIHTSVENMDRKAIGFITEHKSKGFFNYLEATGLSVCGRNPISLFLQLLDTAAARGGHDFSTRLIAYSQSSHARTRTDSSVSYAAICTTRG